MSLGYVTRTFAHADPHSGWAARQLEAFESLMREHAAKHRGAPAIVSAWDDGRGWACWYEARPCPAETALRDRLREVFGCKERGLAC